MNEPTDTSGLIAQVPEYKSKLFRGGAIVAFLLSLSLYIKTMAASSSFWDSGEFIAAAKTLGIPHSPGTPLYVLVGRVFSLIPAWSLDVAERINALSAFCGAAGILFAYLLIVRFLDFTMGKSENSVDTLIKVAGGLCGAFFLAFSDTYWNNAIEAEVYAMSNALMGFMTLLVLKWGENPTSEKSTFLIYSLFYLLALSVGFHLGTILVFSGIFFFILMTREKTFSTFEFIVACLGVGIFIADVTIYRNGQLTLFFLAVYVAMLVWMYSAKSPFAVVCSALFVLGLSVHLYLIIRSGHNPSIDEADPENWRNLYAVLRREQYPPTNLLKRKADFIFQLQHFNGYFQAQYQMASAYVSQLNLGSVLPLGLGIWGIVDQFSKHRKTFVMLFVTLLVMSLGLIIFLNFSDNEVRERDYFYSPAFYYFALYIGLGAGGLLGELRSVVSGARPARLSPVVLGVALVLVLLPFFTLKYHYFSHDRSNNYVCPAYARNMLVGLDKDAVIFTNGDNDTFPLWYIQEVEGFRKDVRVVNLSLLNTGWYIKQCRDLEPKVPISWNDDQIARLAPVVTKEGWLLVRDLAVQEILKTNQFQRPVYFAVTIPPATYSPYRDYLEMEGLAYRVVPRKEKNMINLARMEDNVVNKFSYESVLTDDWKRDNSVYLPSYTEHLIQNYSAAFIQLAYVLHNDSSYDKALKYMKVAHEISPHMNPPRQLLGLYYMDAGQPEEGMKFYRDMLAAAPNDYDIMYRLSVVYDELGRYEDALGLLETILRTEIDNREVMQAAVSTALRLGQVSKAMSYINNWLSRYPNDQTVLDAKRLIEEQVQKNSAGPDSTP